MIDSLQGSDIRKVGKLFFTVEGYISDKEMENVAIELLKQSAADCEKSVLNGSLAWNCPVPVIGKERFSTKCSKRLLQRPLS